VELHLHSTNTPSWRGAQLRNIGTVLPLYNIHSRFKYYVVRTVLGYNSQKLSWKVSG
jgi:hypothetical protein